MRVRMVGVLLLVLSVAVGRGVSQESNSSADLILRNAKIYTVNAKQPWADALAIRGGKILAVTAPVVAEANHAEVIYRGGNVITVDGHGTMAQAIGITAGRIIYVGTDAGANALIGKITRIVDLHGHTVMPGLIDGHMHPEAAGVDLLKCNLNYESLGLSDFQARIRSCLDARRKDPPGSWLEVVNWFRYGMHTDGVPVDRAILDSLDSERPIFVRDSFGHSSLANSKALKLAKITAQTKDPAGGRINRDAGGQATGTLEDAAQQIVGALIPEPTEQEYSAGARAALEAMRRQGITSFLDAVGEEQDIKAFASAERAGVLTARAHFAPLIPPSEANDLASARRAVERVVGVAHQYDEGPLRPAPSLSVRQVKLFMDGVINYPANTGALLEPYLENHGTAQAPKFVPAARREPEVYFPAPILKEILIGLGRHGLDPHLHTDGDGAVRAALDAVEAMQAALPPASDVRPAFAHCELVDPSDYGRFAKLNVTPVLSFQWEKPAPDTVEGVRDTLGPKRAELIEPASRLAAHGARIAYGSDWPVDALDEWFALKVGVTRTARAPALSKYAGRLGQEPGLSPAEVIQAITRNAAYELHDDKSIGSLEVGKFADLIVIDRNPLTVPAEQIESTRVLLTVVGGRTVYDREADPRGTGAEHSAEKRP
jgi:predicted amidohydrolase YtcJ